MRIAIENLSKAIKDTGAKLAPALIAYAAGIASVWKKAG
jgi:hypothetical protein